MGRNRLVGQFIIDGLDALGPIDGLKDALARLGKFSGRFGSGFQSITTIRETPKPHATERGERSHRLVFEGAIPVIGEHRVNAGGHRR